MTETSRLKECGFAAVMVVLSTAFLVRAFMYPAASSQFPRFLMLLQLIFSASLFILSLRIPKAANEGGFKIAALYAPTKVFVSSTVYVLAIGYLGYFAATALFLCGSMYWFGKHRPIVLIGVSGGFILTIYALFVLFIGVRLPEGLLI